ncbi:ribonuclease III [Mycoplasmopsis synoviae]|uniref:ribonuclease III n=1 Tax=Mycoplasmopsis synoviae TaxID=2109 RepID=UPI0034DAEB76
MEKDNQPSIEELKAFLQKNNIEYKNIDLFIEATTHKTYSKVNKNSKDYERLEFLGDSLVGFLISDYCVREFSSLEPGELSRLRSKLVDKLALFKIAQKLKVEQIIKTGPKKARNEVLSSSNVLSDVVEALIAAIYLDQGMQSAKDFIKSHFYEIANKAQNKPNKDPKSELQEYFQTISAETVKYETIEIPNKRSFESKAWHLNKIYGTGVGLSKKDAEKNAATNALSKLKT